MFGDVPQIHAHSEKQLSLPLNIKPINETTPTQIEFTPLIPKSNILESISMDKIILKIKDLTIIKTFFNNSSIKLVNLYNPEKVGKTILALSFAMLMLERNLFFTGGIHFIENKHNVIFKNNYDKSNSMNTTNITLS